MPFQQNADALANDYHILLQGTNVCLQGPNVCLQVGHVSFYASQPRVPGRKTRVDQLSLRAEVFL